MASRLSKNKKFQYPRDIDPMKNNIYNLKKTEDEDQSFETIVLNKYIIYTLDKISGTWT